MSDSSNQRSLRDSLFKAFASALARETDPSDDDRGSSRPKIDIAAAKELIASVATWAGKGKDELVQILFREVGQAIAAMLKEPVNRVIEDRKVQITVELVPRNQNAGADTTRIHKKTASKKKTKRAS